jgi:hypothetical protein
MNRQKRTYVRREDVEGSVVDELLERLLAARNHRLNEAHHGLPLVPVQRVPHEHEPLVPEPLQQKTTVEPTYIYTQQLINTADI